MSDRAFKPVGEGEPYPVWDDNLPDGFERVGIGWVCATCRALVVGRDDAAAHRDWHADLKG